MKFTDSQFELIQEATDLLVVQGVEHVAAHYGPDSADPQEYHHPQHTLETINSFWQIGVLALSVGKITPIELHLGKVAAAWHDSFYDAHDRAQNERKSAELAEAAMNRYTFFDPAHIDLVKRCIMASRMTSFFPRLVQSADPAEYIQGVVADADLHYFGRPPEEFLPRAQAYLKELERTMGQRALPFFMNNVTLLQNHQWNTTEAGTLYPHLGENMEALRSHQTTLAVQ